ncbi:MAG: glycosyltransferase [Chloroflexota bacterium]
MPTISVVIPTYNRADLLPKAIRSVLEQTFADFELIVVDDGSTDTTRQAIADFHDQRIRYIYQPNRGISAALNSGIRAAQGQFMARLDSDDTWLPTLLELEAAAFTEHPHVDIVYAQAQSVDTTGRLLSSRIGRPERYPGQPFKSILCGDFRCSITSLIRMECLERVGLFDETLKGNEDWDLGIRLARYYRFYFLPQVLAHFLYHPKRTTGASSSLFAEIVNSRLTPLDKAFAESNLPSDVQAVRSLAYRNAYIEMALLWKSVGESGKARHAYMAAVKASGNPLATLAHILFIQLFNRVFNRYAWMRQTFEGAAALRRKIRK